MSALLLLGTLVATRAQGQTSSTGSQLGLGTHFGPKIGLTRSVIDGQINTKSFFKSGFSAGVMMRMRLSRGFAVQPELLYSQLGAGGSNSPSSVNPEFEYGLNYFNIPLLFKAYIGNRAYLQAGPQVGFLLAGRKSGTISSSTATADVASDYGGVDFAGVAGLGVDLPNGIVFGARLAYGFADINSNQSEAKFRQQFGLGGVHNRSFELSIGYLFGADKD